MERKPLEKEKLHCPVCKQLLGMRFKGRTTDAKCDECLHIFTYKKSTRIPTFARKPDKRCNCNQCKNL